MKHSDDIVGGPVSGRKPRAAGSPDGWTPPCLATLHRLLHEHPPVSLCHFKGPKRKRQVLVHEAEGFYPARQFERRKPTPLDRGPQCRAVFEKLARSVRDHAEATGYRGFWCLYIEDSRWAGFHFHLWCAETMPAQMVQSLRKTWLRLIGEPDNKHQCFKYDATIRDSEKAISYCGKIFDGEEGWTVKERFTRWGDAGKFRPYRVGNARTSSHLRRGNSHLPAFAGEKKEEAFSRPVTPSVLVPVTNAAIVCPLSEPTRPEHDYTTGGLSGDDDAPRRAVSVSVRVAPLYGPGDLPIPPTAAWAVAHFQRLRTRWRMEPDSIRHPGPGFHPESVEAGFLIPAGRTRDFEQEAARGFARVYRPDTIPRLLTPALQS